MNITVLFVPGTRRTGIWIPLIYEPLNDVRWSLEKLQRVM